MANEVGKGKYVYVFEFWATWCPPCRQTIPHLTDVAHKFASRNVRFLGITNEDNEGTVRRFVDSMGARMDYHVLIDEDGSLSDMFMAKYRVNGIPHAFIVGKNGEVTWHGHPAEPTMEREIEKAASVPDKVAFDPRTMTQDQIASLSVKELKAYLNSKHINSDNVLEKSELVQLVIKNA